MIIIKLQGGLGNQFFQYAFGKALSIKKKNKLRLDVSSYSNDPLRSYKLKYFNVEETTATSVEIFLAKLLKKLGLSQNSHLEGYWQSEKYFSEIKNTIQKAFSLRQPLGQQASNLANQIKNRVSTVSLHIRRSDYATNQKLKGIIQPLPLDYYYKAIELIAKKVSDPHFFIFSDDIKWVKENLMVNYPITYASGDNNIQDHEEIILMGMCSHNIIANSSFSWWGAWLNKNTNKVVIAPKSWFADPSLNTRDLIPETWIQI